MQHLREIDIHELLTERKQIAVIWSIEDVQEVRPDLDEEECWQVLELVSRRHDANDGISWLTRIAHPPRRLERLFSLAAVSWRQIFPCRLGGAEGWI